MFSKLSGAKERFLEVNTQLSNSAVVSDQEAYVKLMKEFKELSPLIERYDRYTAVSKELEDAKELASSSDAELREMAVQEIESLKEEIVQIEEELKIMLLPKDPNDDKNVIVEIRAGAGGEEAALFCGVLFRMYSMYAESKRWKIDILNENETGLGGFKEVSFQIDGAGAYSRLKYESGVHRVQRVPETESSGRIHTSTVTVAVLPEVDDVEVSINPADLQIDTFRAGGAGGQHVNKTESAIRITHIPSGLVVECQDERSQHKNKERALKILRSRLYDMEMLAQHSEIAKERKSQVGTGDRSERIRTYNYPQGRISDHRINMTIYRLEDFLNGDIDEIIDALAAAERAAKLAGGDA